MIVVASTVAAWKCNGRGELAWLETMETMAFDAQRIGEELRIFVAVELDARGLSPFDRLIERLQILQQAASIPFDLWTFSLDDVTDQITTTNRLIRICTGRNLAHEFAMRMGATHILFLDTDTLVPGDCVSKLLEVNHPVVGGEVPNYCLHGPIVPGFDFPVEEHWTTAGFLLVSRDVFKVLRWRWNPDDGIITDDPCFQSDQQVWGFGQTWVRKDVIGEHIEPLVAVENRDADLKRYR